MKFKDGPHVSATTRTTNATLEWHHGISISRCGEVATRLDTACSSETAQVNPASFAAKRYPTQE